MRDYTLHIGAHKTATTWLQLRLAAGRPKLAAVGVDFEPMPSFRAAFTSGFNKAHSGLPDAPSVAAPRDTLAALVARGSDWLLLSDENLIGDCRSITRSGRLYPHIRRRLDLLARLLPHPPARVVLTIRDYAGFFPSAYVETLRFHAFEPFEALRTRLRLDDGLWVRVVAEVVARFGTDAVRVMRFEALEPRLPALLEALFGRPFDPAGLPDVADRREGLSATAVAALAEAAARGDARPPRVLATEAARRYPRGPDHPSFRPWSAAETARLDSLYAAHVEEIDRRWPGILI